ncbi:MAG: DoxX family protein [Weeksellaceae bacterium]|nr:DoxX family protein [Weeksellaceae bacterium]
MQISYIKLFLRLALSASFLSAVADRLGYWPAEVSVWGNWQAFTEYTQIINPWLPASINPAMATIATVAEVILAIALILGFKTRWAAILSGILLLIFALSMTLSTGIKGAFDYSVFTAAAAAFALSAMPQRFLEVDSLLEPRTANLHR